MQKALLSFLAPAVALSIAVLAAVGLSQDPRRPAAELTPLVDAAEYPSLQAAFDALPPTGGIVSLPAATIEIREPIVVRSGDVLVRGAGTASHIHNANAEGKPAFLFSSGRALPRQRERLEAVWRVQLSDFRLTGNDRSGHGIEARFVNEFYADGLTVSEHGGDGIYLHFCYEDPRINDALITYNKGAGVHAVGCHDTVVSGCHFEENSDGVRFIDGFNLTATGNNIDDHLRHGVVIENSMGNTVSANMIEQCRGVGILLDRDTYGTTVGSNVFSNDYEGGVDLRDAHGCTITGNTFSRVPRRAVAIDGRCHAITISGNTFTDSSVGDGEFKGPAELNKAAGIVLDGAAMVTITGNTFSNLATKALALTGMRRPGRQVVFTSNLLINCDSDHEQLADSVVQANLQTTVPRPAASR